MAKKKKSGKFIACEKKDNKWRHHFYESTIFCLPFQDFVRILALVRGQRARQQRRRRRHRVRPPLSARLARGRRGPQVRIEMLLTPDLLVLSYSGPLCITQVRVLCVPAAGEPGLQRRRRSYGLMQRRDVQWKRTLQVKKVKKKKKKIERNKKVG